MEITYMPKPHEFQAKCRVSERGCKFEAKFVCLHCGKPLCENPKCHIDIPERLLKKEPPLLRKTGIHCPDCAQKYHPFYLPLLPLRTIWIRFREGWAEKFAADEMGDEAETSGVEDAEAPGESEDEAEEKS